MEHRHQRRALPARGHVGGAKIEHDTDAKPLRQRGAVAELDSQPVLRPVQHGLAMEADHRDVLRCELVLREESFDRFGMSPRDQRLGFAQRTRARHTIGQSRSVNECSP